MSDRVVFAVASIPMISGALLLVALQRVPPVRVAASASRSRAVHADVREDQRLTWPGVVVAGASADLASDLDGRVTEVWVKPGTRVRKGEPILQIDSSDARNAEALAGAELGQRRSEVERAQARWEEALQRLSRVEQGREWIAAQEVEAARSAERMAKADLYAAKAGVGMGRARVAQQRLRSRRHTLVAPFDGVLASCDVDPGDSVHAGQSVARVIDDRRQVRFALPREQLPTTGALDVLLTVVADAQQPLTARTLRGTVDSLQPEVDPAAQLVFATATAVEEGASLMPGTRVEVTAVEAQRPALREER